MSRTLSSSQTPALACLSTRASSGTCSPLSFRRIILKISTFSPLPYLPDIDDVCAYYNKETGLHGKNKELLDIFRRFFDDYRSGKEPEKTEE